MNVELTRFKVQKGKSARVDDWMLFLNKHMKEVLLTLVDEKMYVETIFRERVGDTEYLYWYSVQGHGGVEVQDSQHEVDRKHLEFWNECIDENEIPVNMKTEVVMIQESISCRML